MLNIIATFLVLVGFHTPAQTIQPAEGNIEPQMVYAQPTENIRHYQIQPDDTERCYVQCSASL